MTAIAGQILAFLFGISIGFLAWRAVIQALRWLRARRQPVVPPPPLVEYACVLRLRGSGKWKEASVSSEWGRPPRINIPVLAERVGPGTLAISLAQPFPPDRPMFAAEEYVLMFVRDEDQVGVYLHENEAMALHRLEDPQ